MSETGTPGFSREIYEQLDRKLRESPWQSGASEAHGLLTGLACRGISDTQVQNKLYLFNSDDPSLATLVQGLFELVLRDLKSSTPAFDLLLPGEDEAPSRRSDELAGWCSGFVQGYLHDGEHALSEGSAETREIIRDIMDISSMEHGLTGNPEEDSEAEKSLVEVEEYLRVAVQFVYDERVSDFTESTPAPTETH